MKKIKSFGYGILAFFPAILTVVMQGLIANVILVVVMAILSSQTGGALGSDSLLNQAYDLYMEHYMDVLLATQFITLLMMAPWYYFSFVWKKEHKDRRSVFRFKNLLSFLLLGVGIYLLIVLYQTVVYQVAPDAMSEYNELMEESGIAGLTILSTLASLLMAPVGEEIVFRGLCLGYFRKTGMPFFIANTLQALLFGVAHMNWIQGIYAFVLGLILGYITKRFGTLVAPMLLHLIFNFCGTYVATFAFMMGDGFRLDTVIVVSVVCVILSLKLMGRPVQREQETISIQESVDARLDESNWLDRY